MGEKPEHLKNTSTRKLARKCNARVKRGRYCKLTAGHGTDHPGTGLCYKHGGNSERSLRLAGISMAHHGIMNPDVHPGDIVELEPHNALMWSIWIAGGDVSYWNNELQKLDDKEREDVGKVAKLFAQQRNANKELRSAAKMAIEAGIAERQVMLAERLSSLMAQFARNLLSRVADHLPPEMENQMEDIIYEELLKLEHPDGSAKQKPKMSLTQHKRSELIDRV